VSELRRARKKARVQSAVSDPSKFAFRKVSRNLKKRDRRKEKTAALRERGVPKRDKRKHDDDDDDDDDFDANARPTKFAKTSAGTGDD